MKRWVLRSILLMLVITSISISAVAAQSPTRQYIVISHSQFGVSSSVLNQIQAAGGQVVNNLSRMGLVIVSSSNPNFTRSVPAARAIAPNRPVKTANPETHLGPALSTEIAGPPNTVGADTYFNLEWNITAVDAQNAWVRGRFGAGALVAVLDEGVDATHPDLAPNVRADLSTSFAEDCDGNLEDWQPPAVFDFNHGTHVAGIVAASVNGKGVIGVAPKAQIMAVEVLSRCLGYGLDSWILDGILYAADHGADVINMSLGSGPLDSRGACDEFGCYTSQEVINLFLAYSYAALYANSRGSTVVASSGNDGFDFGANPTFVHLPSDALGILSVSATAPIGWGVDPETDLDVPTYYANFGRGRIDFSAPGGTDEYYYTSDTAPNDVCQIDTVIQYCFVLDYVFSDIPGGYAWAAGTSMAAPHVSGIAAQYIGAAGGSLPPVVVEYGLRLLADHPNGNPGRDPFFGFGRVDATIED